ncbi:MAG: phosphotransferase [Candidatus Coatesbacteria bacterium]|nr:phosphotransferase [Candidatus Coatesbacteria bacterium]
MSAFGMPGAFGRTAELYPLADGRAVKLYRRGMDGGLERELAAARRAAALGLPVPAVHGVIELEGRRGLVFDLIDGEDYQHLLESGRVKIEETARLCGSLHHQVHRNSGAELPSIKERLDARLGRFDDRLPSSTLREARERLDELPDGDRLLHGDFHPGNLLRADEAAGGGVWIIDWIDAARGEPAADLARSFVLYNFHARRPDEPAFERGEMTALARRFTRLHLEAYAEVAGEDLDGLFSKLAFWLLPVAAARLAEDIPGLDELLIPFCNDCARGDERRWLNP